MARPETDYADWESSNNRLGTVVLGLFALLGVFGIFAGLKRARETR